MADKDLDVAVVHSLLLLTEGDTAEFQDHQQPPTGIARWVCNADLREIRGLLIACLGRWHEFRG